MSENDPALLTVAEAARQAGMTIEGIRDAVRRGKLRAEVVATGPVYGIHLEDLQTYLRQAENEPGEWMRSPEQPDGASLPLDLRASAGRSVEGCAYLGFEQHRE
jgi:excisionase family DNA binding protein